MKTQFLRIALLFVSVAATSQTYQPAGQPLSVALHGNTYVTKGQASVRINEKGANPWSDASTELSTFVHSSQPETFNLYLEGQFTDPKATARVTAGGQSFRCKLAKPDAMGRIFVGKVKTTAPGYLEIKLQGEKKSGETFARVTGYILEGLQGKISYVKEFSPYWGNRGPSVHLAYAMPAQPTEWFYNEVTVPKGEEVMGSYYMANGFGEGYFGMQCNSETERRVLFSVWSPFDTQDPKLIPDEDKIKLLRRGEGVHIGEFGNEGSGGQSYLRFNWQSGNTYKFLAQVKPDGKGNTVYTAYFFAPEENRWRLIASFLRPKTNVHYTRAHSFLENFNPQQGHLSRRVFFGNQFCRGVDGVWRAVTQASFTHDATANAKARLDYAGGTEGNRFFLKNCGFFNENTAYGTKLLRTGQDHAPVIDFDALEKL